MADTMQLISAFKVEQDLQDKWREERVREIRSDDGRKNAMAAECPTLRANAWRVSQAKN